MDLRESLHLLNGRSFHLSFAIFHSSCKRRKEQLPAIFAHIKNWRLACLRIRGDHILQVLFCIILYNTLIVVLKILLNPVFEFGFVATYNQV